MHLIRLDRGHACIYASFSFFLYHFTYNVLILNHFFPLIGSLPTHCISLISLGIDALSELMRGRLSISEHDTQMSSSSLGEDVPHSLGTSNSLSNSSLIFI